MPLVCGIAGILRRPDEPVDEADLRAMAAALAHRGPDDEGFHLAGNIGLAHRRLSILDLTPAGHQPMGNEDGSVWVVYNGQLYGFEDRRAWLQERGHRFRSRTDTELIVHLYEEKGDELVEDLDGMFAFALWDARKRRLLLARDRLGIKPLYYARHGSALAFASELKALRALPWLPQEVDLEPLVHYLYQSSVPGELCILKAHAQVRPGHLHAFTAEGETSRRFWRLDAEAPARASFDAAAEAIEQRLDDAVRRHLVSDVPVGTFLSGGIDSALVTLMAGRAMSEPPQTFSVRFPEVPSHDEGAAARETAAALGTRHRELELGADSALSLIATTGQADEPFAVSSALALSHLARFAREHVKVVLTGDGADEILGGYPWRHEPSLPRGIAMALVRSGRAARAGGPSPARLFRARLARMRRADERYTQTLTAFTPEELEALVVPDLAAAVRSAWSANRVRARYRESPFRDEVNRRLHADLETTLVDEMLAKVDRTTMAAGLEARVPFLDRRLVEAAFRQPGRYKVRRGTGKLILRRLASQRLPAAARRPKHGFDVPLGEWLRGPLRETLRDTLSPDAVRRRGLFEPAAVERMVMAHLDGRGNYARKLYTLLALEMWFASRPAAAEAGAAIPRLARIG
jgi:asparagine synthase (glutamine-hydrolysing)